MPERENQRQADIFCRNPSIKARFEELYAMRCGEIINELLQTDDEYMALTKNRVATSQAVLKILGEHGMADYFEAYSDAVYAEEVYELDVIYKEAFLDAVEVMEKLELL